jgi:hypothetical protein
VRRTRFLALTLALVAALMVAGTEPSASAAACGTGTVMVRGRIFDAATGLPVTTASGVEFYAPDGSDIDGGSVDPDGRWYSCFDPNVNSAIKIRFVPDEYRPEWWNDKPNLGSADELAIPPVGSDPVVANAWVTPQGRVLSGRVTNLAGAPRFASVGIWRLTATGWRSIDGIGNDPRTGIWSFRVPVLGRYRISAHVDSHWARWYRSATRLRFANTVTVGLGTTFISGLDIKVPYCHPAPTFCTPAGFNT